ncbi:unnamed protein product [Sympodiomycopsis kandeliae]
MNVTRTSRLMQIKEEPVEIDCVQRVLPPSHAARSPSPSASSIDPLPLRGHSLSLGTDTPKKQSIESNVHIPPVNPTTTSGVAHTMSHIRKAKSDFWKKIKKGIKQTDVTDEGANQPEGSGRPTLAPTLPRHAPPRLADPAQPSIPDPEPPAKPPPPSDVQVALHTPRADAGLGRNPEAGVAESPIFPTSLTTKDEQTTNEIMRNAWTHLNANQRDLFIRLWPIAHDLTAADGKQFKQVARVFWAAVEAIFEQLPMAGRQWLGQMDGTQPAPLDEVNLGWEIRSTKSFPSYRLLDAFLAITVRVQAGPDDYSEDKEFTQFREALENSFHEKYEGPAATALASHLNRLESLMQKQDFSKAGAYHSRTLTIVQSSGCGKTRMVEELHNQSDFFVVSICLRSKKDAGQTGYPIGDVTIFEYLKKGPRDPSWRNSSEYLACKAGALLYALYTEILESLDGRGTADVSEHWTKQISRQPATSNPTAKQAREYFLQRVAMVATAKFEQLEAQATRSKDDTMAIRQGLHIDTAALANQIRDRLGTKAFLVVAFDEAAALSLMADAASPVDRTIAAFRTYFVPEFGDGRLLAPSRSWLILMDTNSALGSLAPRPPEATSARVITKELRLFSPYFALDINVKLSPKRKKEILQELSPMCSSLRSVQAFFGRPLWQSYIVIEAQKSKEIGKKARPSDSSDRSVRSIGMGSLKDPRIKCLLTTDIILLKLLSKWPSRDGKFGPLDEDSLMGMLTQRLALDFRTDQSVSGAIPIEAEEYTRRQVHNHLRLITGYDDATVQTRTLSEPVVSTVAAELFRNKASMDRWITTSPVLTLQTLWSLAWDTIRKCFLSSASPLDKGQAGEVSAQAILLMAVDTAVRRSLPSLKHQGPLDNQTLAHGNFVHLADFLPQAFDLSGEAGEEAVELAQHRADLWVSFTHFTKVTYDLSPSALARAWLRHEALALKEGAKDYDLVIPVYCGRLDLPHDESAYTFIAAQVKGRKRTSTPSLPELKWEGWQPLFPPVYLWMETRPTFKITKDARVLNRGIKVVVSGSARDRGAKDIQILNRGFNADEHPCLPSAMGNTAAGSFALLPALGLVPPEGWSKGTQEIIERMQRDEWEE